MEGGMYAKRSTCNMLILSEKLIHNVMKQLQHHTKLKPVECVTINEKCGSVEI